MLASALTPTSSLVCQRTGRCTRSTAWQPCVPAPLPSLLRRSGVNCGASQNGNGVHTAEGTASPQPQNKPVITEGLGNGDSVQGASASASSGGGLARSDFPKFVQFFRQASPYIAGHRGKTFVIVIPGNVTIQKPLLQSIMSDVAMLHGLGIRLVVVVGAQNHIDNMLQARNITPTYMGGYRITDTDALNVAIEAAGQVRTVCEQILSKGPAIPMIRRHTKGEGEIHFEPALRVISGNFVTAKRRGIVDGVDFGYTGEVRFTLKDDIASQLDGGNVVLLSNLGFTAAGEVLNCNTCDVGLHAAVELGADKLFFLHLDEVSDLKLPEWLPLSDAQDLLVKKLKDSLSTEQMAFLKETIDVGPQWTPHGPASPVQLPKQAVAMQVSRVASRLATKSREDLVVDLDVWSASGLPTAVSTCVVACCKGERGQGPLKSMTARFEKSMAAAGLAEKAAALIAPGMAPAPVAVNGLGVEKAMQAVQHDVVHARAEVVHALASSGGNGVHFGNAIYSSTQGSQESYGNDYGNGNGMVTTAVHGHSYPSTTTSLTNGHVHSSRGPTYHNGHTANGFAHASSNGIAIVDPPFGTGSVPTLIGYDDRNDPLPPAQFATSTPGRDFGTGHDRRHAASRNGRGRHDDDDRPMPKGIKRAHLLDARMDGVLLLELYSRDGVGTMISADFYEGIRPAGPTDLDAVHALLKPLEEAGTLVKRSREDVANMLQDFTVVERENKVLGCALLVPLGLDEEGVSVAEVGAFCIDPAFRGSGRGDSLLDYVEQRARTCGIQRLVLLTTRTADWFEQRDFKWIGPAYASKLLPEPRRAKVNPARNSQLYAKQMEAPRDDGLGPGKRIGF